jgi:hypothetical protein
LRRLGLLSLFAAVFVAAVLAGTARADGDPASDYLITQLVFLPFEQPVSSDVEKQFRDLLAESKDKGYEVRTAVIGSPRDLGAIPSLFRQPQRYADFLGQELVYYWKGPVLVVMPNGYGIFQSGKSLKEDKAVLAKLKPANLTQGDALAASAKTAVRALAARRGITLSTETTAEKGSSHNRDRVVLAIGVILLAAVAFGARVLLGRRRGGAETA